MNKRDLSGIQFHELKVIEPAGYMLHGTQVYKCECSCKKICYVRGNRLTTGNTKSCGHLKIQAAALRRGHKGRDESLKGKRFDDFIVDEYSHNDEKSHYAVWKCHCIYCNEIRYLSSTYLKHGCKTKCNCRQSD